MKQDFIAQNKEKTNKPSHKWPGQTLTHLFECSRDEQESLLGYCKSVRNVGLFSYGTDYITS